MDELRQDVPSEFIDLSTGPFRAAFPDIAERRDERARRARKQPPGGGEGDDR